MKIYIQVQRTFVTGSTNDDLFALAKNSVIPLGYGATSDEMVIYTSIEPNNARFLGILAGGSSQPIQTVTPAYFPYATAGSECAAIVSTLDWADNNLAEGYEWLQLNNGAGTEAYFVSGVLTSSETQFNDPFAAAGFTKGCCWAGDYKIGVNPFA